MTPTQKHTHAYIGKKPCGCVVAGVVDDLQRKDGVGEAVADFIRVGLTVERVPIDQARLTPDECEHEEVE